MPAKTRAAEKPVAAVVSAVVSSTEPGLKAPGDFALSVCLAGVGGSDPLLAPAWFVLDPDGKLRVAVGERARYNALPPSVRTLGRADMDRLYEFAMTSGLSGALSVTQTPAGSAGLTVAMTSNRRTSSTVWTPAALTALPGDHPARELVKRLRVLGWLDTPERP